MKFSKVLKALVFLLAPLSIFAFDRASKQVTPGSKHGTNPIHTSYVGKVMAGYQGWFRAEGDGSGRGWVHWGRERFDDKSCTVEALPDMSEYEKSYDSGFKDKNGNPVKVFSSYDYQTVDTHFKWMKEYDIDGVMVQRFFGSTHPRFRRDGAQILKHSIEASKKYGRALVVMYDLSGVRPNQDASNRLIEDWKFLVDELKVTAGDKTNYLFHNGGPLVSIWGLGFIDRPYTLDTLGIEKFIKFLKEDKEYGGCSVMIGVPPTFRTLEGDTRSDPRLHEIIKTVDVVSPWNPGRFSLAKQSHEELASILNDRVSKDVEFCEQMKVDYAPVIYPGFSWHNLMYTRNQKAEFNWAPRLKGEFYWTLARLMISNNSKMIYVAMFDEVDEGTAILKISDDDSLLPVNTGCKFLTTEGMGSDYYLWLTGEIGKVLRGKKVLGDLPKRDLKSDKK